MAPWWGDEAMQKIIALLEAKGYKDHSFRVTQVRAGVSVAKWACGVQFAVEGTPRPSIDTCSTVAWRTDSGPSSKMPARCCGILETAWRLRPPPAPLASSVCIAPFTTHASSHLTNRTAGTPRATHHAPSTLLAQIKNLSVPFSPPTVCPCSQDRLGSAQGGMANAELTTGATPSLTASGWSFVPGASDETRVHALDQRSVREAVATPLPLSCRTTPNAPSIPPRALKREPLGPLGSTFQTKSKFVPY